MSVHQSVETPKPTTPQEPPRKAPKPLVKLRTHDVTSRRTALRLIGGLGLTAAASVATGQAVIHHDAVYRAALKSIKDIRRSRDMEGRPVGKYIALDADGEPIRDEQGRIVLKDEPSVIKATFRHIEDNTPGNADNKVVLRSTPKTTDDTDIRYKDPSLIASTANVAPVFGDDYNARLDDPKSRTEFFSYNGKTFTGRRWYEFLTLDGKDPIDPETGYPAQKPTYIAGAAVIPQKTSK